MAVDISASCRASMVTWYGVTEGWGLGGGLAAGGEGGGGGAQMIGGGEAVVSTCGAGARPIRLDTSQHQSVCWAPEQWMPNALLSGPWTMGKTVPHGQCHFLLRMGRLLHTAETFTVGKHGGGVRMSPICKWKICSICNQNGEEGCNIRGLLALSRSPMGHVCDHIAWSHSRKAQTFSTTNCEQIFLRCATRMSP